MLLLPSSAQDRGEGGEDGVEALSVPLLAVSRPFLPTPVHRDRRVSLTFRKVYICNRYAVCGMVAAVLLLLLLVACFYTLFAFLSLLIVTKINIKQRCILVHAQDAALNFSVIPR